MTLRPGHVRTRLTAWYVAVLAAVLLIYGGFTSGLLLYQLRAQVDHQAIEDLETVEGLLSFAPDGKVQLRSDYHDHPHPEEVVDRLMEVWSADGRLLYRNDLLGKRALGGPPEAGEGVASYSERSLRLSDGMRVRLVSKHHILEGRPTVIHAWASAKRWFGNVSGRWRWAC